MDTRIIRHHDLIRRPWKNGGGTTAEILVEPPGADLDSFDWRISMADVASEGPFSTFADTDRTLILIDGAALSLNIDGTVHRLDSALRFVAFSGDARTWATLPHGPIRDLNVMTRRDRFTHRARVMPLADQAAAPAGELVVVVSLDERSVVAVGPRIYELGQLDVVVVESPLPTIRLQGGAAILIEIAKR